MKMIRTLTCALLVALTLAFAGAGGARPASAAPAALITLSGIKYNDVNGDGSRQQNEPGLAGWTIYLDINNNLQLDSGEPSAITDATGVFTITTTINIGQDPVSYMLREVGQPNWVQTEAPPLLTFPPLSYDIKFGNHFMPPPSEVPESDTLWLFGAGGIAMALYLVYRRRTQSVPTA